MIGWLLGIVKKMRVSMSWDLPSFHKEPAKAVGMRRRPIGKPIIPPTPIKITTNLAQKPITPAKATGEAQARPEAERPETAPAGPPEGAKVSRDLNLCHPELQRRILALKADFEAKTGMQLFFTCTWRSAEAQAELYMIGRRGVKGEKRVTWIDGKDKKSLHNFYPSRAIDVAVDVDPGIGVKVTWDPGKYEPLGAMAKKHGLVWGGNWRRGRKDRPHLQLPEEVA